MEIFCSKQTEDACTLEYKMTVHKSEQPGIGAVNMYGFRVKLCSPNEFDYYCAEEIAAKPQTVLQIIKHLFDHSVKPAQVYANVERFLQN